MSVGGKHTVKSGQINPGFWRSAAISGQGMEKMAPRVEKALTGPGSPSRSRKIVSLKLIAGYRTSTLVLFSVISTLEAMNAIAEDLSFAGSVLSGSYGSQLADVHPVPELQLSVQKNDMMAEACMSHQGRINAL
jgi:hypothetical protein